MTKIKKKYIPLKKKLKDKFLKFKKSKTISEFLKKNDN